MDEITEKWVVPFYLQILHGNYVRADEGDFIERSLIALSEITPPVVDALFANGNWRSLITAAWFAGMKRWRQYADQIGHLLIESRRCFSGQGYCFAFACYADEKSVEYLSRYLEIYLSQPEKFYDQAWAMPALMWVDDTLQTTHSQRFLEKDGPWDQFVAGKTPEDVWLIKNRKADFYRLMEFSKSTWS